MTDHPRLSSDQQAVLRGLGDLGRLLSHHPDSIVQRAANYTRPLADGRRSQIGMKRIRKALYELEELNLVVRRGRSLYELHRQGRDLLDYWRERDARDD